MKLKHIVIAAAAAVALPAFAQESSDLIFKWADAPSKRTVAEVRAETTGLKNYGEVGSPFLFDAIVLKDSPMLTRAQVRAMISNGVIEVMSGA